MKGIEIGEVAYFPKVYKDQSKYNQIVTTIKEMKKYIELLEQERDKLNEQFRAYGLIS